MRFPLVVLFRLIKRLRLAISKSYFGPISHLIKQGYERYADSLSVNNMRLLEHEAKAILRSNMVPIPSGQVITKVASTDSIYVPIVLKSQVPIGGRGKLGGVVIVESTDQLKGMVDKLFSLDIKGYKPNTLL